MPRLPRLPRPPAVPAGAPAPAHRRFPRRPAVRRGLAAALSLAATSVASVVVGLGPSSVPPAGAACGAAPAPASVSVPVDVDGSGPLQGFTMRASRWQIGASGTSDVALVNGFAHDADFWRPFVDRLACDSRVRNVYAIDLPGHGSSGWPQGFLQFYGFMRFNQYTEAVRQTLAVLRTQDGNNGIEVLVGHSMGGLLVQDLQAEALGSGTTIRDQFGVKKVLLLASVLPEEVTWRFADGENAVARVLLRDLLPNLCTNTSAWCAQPLRPGGLYAEVQPANGRRLFFNSCAGAQAAPPCVSDTTYSPPRSAFPAPPAGDAPSDAEWASIAAPEGVFVALDVLGLGGATRPSVPANAFAGTGTQLRTVAYQYDYFFDVAEQTALAARLTGSGANQFRVDGNRAVHDAPWSYPEAHDAAIGWALAP